jgi:hypothetical protein
MRYNRPNRYYSKIASIPVYGPGAVSLRLSLKRYVNPK